MKEDSAQISRRTKTADEQSFERILARNIRKIRMRKGMSQVALAKACGKETVSTLSQYERGIRSPKVYNLVLIANALNVSVDDLINGTALKGGEAVGERILRLREMAGMTQNDLASALGVSSGTISKYEAGRIDLTVSSIRKIADVFSVTTDELIYGKEAYDAAGQG